VSKKSENSIHIARCGLLVPLIETFSYYLIMISLGMSSSVLGPKLADLAKNVNRDVSKMGWIFTGRSIGSLCGNIIAGKIFDILKNRSAKSANILIVFMGLIYSSIWLAIPIVYNMHLLVFVFVGIGFCSAFTNMGSNLLLIWTWKDKVTPYILTAHCMFGVGSFLSPLMLRFVLQTEYAFFLIGIVNVIAALSVSIGPAIYIFNRSNNISEKAIIDNKIQKDIDDQDLKFDKSKPLKHSLYVLFVKSKSIRVALLIGFALSCVSGIEQLFGNFLFTYNMQKNIMDEQQNKMLTTVYFLFYTLGRLAAAVLSSCIKPIHVLSLDISGCILGMTGFFALPQNRIVIYLLTSLVGMSCSSLFPTTYSFPTSSMEGMSNTGVMTSIMLVMTSITSMVLPVVITEIIGIPNMFWVFLVVCILLSCSYTFLFIWSKGMKAKARSIDEEPELIEIELQQINEETEYIEPMSDDIPEASLISSCEVEKS
jgi:FHS family Na+ dependent glucose MFS transporter 1